MGIRQYIITLSCVVLMICNLNATDSMIRLESDHFRALFPEDKRELAKGYLATAELARNRALQDVSKDFNKKTDLLYCPTEKEFLKKTGMNPEHILAAALPKKNIIYINGERASMLSPDNIYSVLIHEYAHIYIGNNVRDDLPRWLDEGLAMHMAGEWSMGRSMKLTWARIFGNLIPISRLEGPFPTNKEALDMAYIQSYSLTDFTIKRFYGEGGLKEFLKTLSDPRDGERMLILLDDPLILRGLEIQWKKSLGGRFKNFILVITSGSVLWFSLASLFIYAYVKKRKEAKAKLKSWEEDEPDYINFEP